MKLLHTADLHIGRTIRTRSRLDEHHTVLSEILDLAKDEGCTAILLAGDIYHDKRPDIGAQQLFNDWIARIVNSGIAVVAIAGNHDDPHLLGSITSLARQAGQITICSGLTQSWDTVTLHARYDITIGMLPYVPPQAVISSADGIRLTTEARIAAYSGSLSGIWAHLAANAGCDILMSHIHVADTDYGGGEWRSSIYPITPATLPATVRYHALGHIHKPQAVGGVGADARAHYAGSPLQMDFGERDQAKSVNIIDITPTRCAVEVRPLTSYTELLRLKGTLAQVRAHDFGSALVEVRLTDKPAPEDIDKLRAAHPGIVSCRYDRAPAVVEVVASADSDSHTPEQSFSHFYRHKHGEEPPPELIALFSQLYAADKGVE